MVRAALLSILIACSGGSKPASTPANVSSGSSTANGREAEHATHPDCLGGGVAKTDVKTASCAFWGEVMGSPKADGQPSVVKCCYATAEDACKHTGGCELADCVFAEATTPSAVTCRDTTHGGAPTNP